MSKEEGIRSQKDLSTIANYELIMMNLTHITISGTAASLILGTTDSGTLIVSAIAGLLPDVDISTSPAGRVLPWLSNWLEKRSVHRSCTHSLLATGIVAVLAYGIVWANNKEYLYIAHAITIGYFFGWFADGFTKAGVAMFFPLRERYVCPGNKKFRITTGSPTEYGLLVILITLAIFIFNLNANGGILNQFNRLIASPSGVEDIYNQSGSTNLIKVHVKGVRNSDRLKVDDDFSIVQASGQNFIVMSNDHKLYKVGIEPDCQIIVQQITADVGEIAITNIESVTLQDESVEEKLSHFVKPSSSVFVTGNITIDDSEEVTLVQDPYQFPFIHKDDKTIKLEAAPLAKVTEQIGDQFGTGQLSIRSITINQNSGLRTQNSEK